MCIILRLFHYDTPTAFDESERKSFHVIIDALVEGDTPTAKIDYQFDVCFGFFLFCFVLFFFFVVVLLFFVCLFVCLFVF